VLYSKLVLVWHQYVLTIALRAMSSSGHATSVLGLADNMSPTNKGCIVSSIFAVKAFPRFNYMKVVQSAGRCDRWSIVEQRKFFELWIHISLT
jgi:hypothetical protein